MLQILTTLTGLAVIGGLPFVTEFHEKGLKQAARMGDWKAIRLGPNEPLELYNLKTDLAETRNVTQQHPKIVAKIEAYLKTARTESEHWPMKSVTAE